jgi:hypothetical protein
VGVVGVVAGVVSIIDSPVSWGLDPGRPGLAWVATGVLSVTVLVLVLGFFGHVIHQLRVVDRVHRRLVTVDVFRLGPLYAFSTFTARTGIALIGFAVVITVLTALTTGTFAMATSDAVLNGIAFIVAIACFIVPLLGLHDRSASARDDHLAEAQTTLAAALAEVRRRIAAGDMHGAARHNDAVQAANLGVLVVSRVSTWPWRADTLRGFLSAVFLPIGLWLVITLLGRLLPA